MRKDGFSRLHPFTHAQVEQVVEAVANEAPSKRLLVSVTTAHRQNAINQWALNQLAFWLIVSAIFFAELLEPSVASATTRLWLAVGAANWTARALLYYLIFRAAPADVSRLLRFRLIPLLIMLISTGHWVWSVYVFVTPALTPTVLVLYIGFVALTIAGIGNLLVTPVAAGMYISGLWLGLSLRAAQVDLMPWPLILAIDGCVAVILWLCIYMSVKRPRIHLERSDQVDLLMAELRRTNSEFARTNAELEVMKNEAAATLEKRSIFFAGASHDFKQRLHAMKLMLHSTIAHTGESDPSRPALSRLSAEVQELESFITHFLAFARIEALDEKPQLHEVSLLRLFQEIDLRFEDLAASRNVRLHFRATRVRLRTDPRQLLQILENLVSNALKFTRGGVVVASRGRGGGVAIEVWDDGWGIRSDALPKIFDAFYQGTGAVPQGARGVGLGLAVVKRFADRLGCTVSVASRPGRGSVFRIDVPASMVLAS
jgi:signal transduction histidine kinase